MVHRCPSSQPIDPALRSRPVTLALAAFIGVLLAATIALWAHYGTAVFYEIITAGIAACF